MKEDRYEFPASEWEHDVEWEITHKGGVDFHNPTKIILTRKKGVANVNANKEVVRAIDKVSQSYREVHRRNKAVYSLGFIWGALQLYIKDDRPRLDLEYHVEVVQKQLVRSMENDEDSPS